VAKGMTHHTLGDAIATIYAAFLPMYPTEEEASIATSFVICLWTEEGVVEIEG
jgi:hypothetical protein